MKPLDCKLERLSNTMVGAILFFFGMVFTLLGLIIIPVIGLLIALPVIVMGTIFILAPRSGVCTLLAVTVFRIQGYSRRFAIRKLSPATSVQRQVPQRISITTIFNGQPLIVAILVKS